MKFGGSVLDSPSKIKTIVNIMKSFENNKDKHEIICVISAMTGITDKILLLSDLVTKGDKRAINVFINEMTILHLELLDQVITDPILQSEAKGLLLDTMKEFQAILDGLVLISEITPRSLDHILSFGERLMAPIICYSLKNQGIRSKYFTGNEIGIVTDSNFGEASPLMNTTKFRVSAKLPPYDRNGSNPCCNWLYHCKSV